MRQINRRSFLKKASLLGAGTLLGQSLWGRFIGTIPQTALAQITTPELVSIKGKDYFANTAQAIEQLGGIDKFVKRGDRVGLLVNSPFKHFGTSVNPDITLAVIDLCKEAGAKEIRYLKDPHRRYWNWST
ncbi:MAG: twin-arginine translocation signal domain-containing protein, partial [Desulfobacterales bacterium]